jgi:LmbE family N-acetylglucosaminyl deacetylase
MYDLSLQVKRTLFASGFALARTRLGRSLTATMVRAPHPGLALQAGEELLSRPWRILALTAHPDDLEFFAGGTIRRLVLAGSQVTAACMTDGEKRGNRANLGQVRREEQLSAAKKQGIERVRFVGLTDFGLPEEPRLERAIADLWAEVHPELVLAFDPKEIVPGMANRDHKALGRTVIDLSRQYVGRTRVYLYGTHHPNVLVDIGAVIQQKEEVVLAHRSQMLLLTDPGYRQAVRWWAEVAATRAPCQYAEALYRLL